MNNDFLRVNSKKVEGVNVSSFGGKKQEEKKAKNPNSIFSFMVDEHNDDICQTLNNMPITAVNKPKLLSAVYFFVYFAVLNLILASICFLSNKLSMAVIVGVVASLFIPVSLLYFFFKLDTRGGLSLVQVIKCVGVGMLVYFITETIYLKISDEFSDINYLALFLKSSFEILIVLILTVFLVKNTNKRNLTSFMLIACAIAVGFSICRAVADCFSALFVSVQVSNGGHLSSVGAIINNPEMTASSIKNLIKEIPTVYLNGTLFTLLSVINGWCVYKGFFASGKREASLPIFITLFFTLTLNSVALITEGIVVMGVVFGVFAIFMVGYVTFLLVDNAIKSENYKD